jgi:hypothetical protein
VIRTALVEGVTRTVPEAVRTRDLREPREHAEPLYPLQERRVRQWLVGRDLPAVRRLDRLAEDGDTRHLRLQMQGQLLIAGRDLQLANPRGRHETRGQERLVGKDEAQEVDVGAEDQGRIKDDLGKWKCIPSFNISRISRLG